jgi:hypothetical protein
VHSKFISIIDFQLSNISVFILRAAEGYGETSSHLSGRFPWWCDGPEPLWIGQSSTQISHTGAAPSELLHCWSLHYQGLFCSVQ